ncbi:MAG: hypothetical protein IJM76_09540 [Lachnospiraceae bacterium]|nr:hypothetical protein [Lachnospiraceae bacterium]
MDSSEIKRDMRDFQDSVLRLSSGIGNASVLWRDPQFQALSRSVSGVAIQSRDLLAAGDRCVNAIERFQRISEESY